MADNEQEIDRIVQEFLDRAGEHCESIRVFMTYPKDGGEESVFHTVGSGNYYAQLGQVFHWLTMQEQSARNMADNDQTED